MYKIADLNINFSKMSDYFGSLSNNYLTNDTAIDIMVSVSKSDILSERKNCSPEIPEQFVESSCALRAVAEKLPFFEGFLLHSAVLDADGTGIAFAAKSGTGKTTHLRLWKQLLGDSMTVVNGDKPFVRFIEGKPFAYGTPWNGKEHFGTNMKTEIKHICFINRSEENLTEPLDEGEALDLIMNQIYFPRNPEAAVKTLELAGRFLKSCRLWRINCNMLPSAAECSYNKIFNSR